MKFLGKISRLGLAADYSMLRLLTEGAEFSSRKCYKTRSLEILNICLVIKEILNKFEIKKKIKIFRKKLKL